MTLDGLKQDLLYFFRSLRRDTSFFLGAILIIGVGIGANTAIFSMANGVLFRPLPFHASDRLVWIANRTVGDDLSSVTSRVANYQDWKRLNRSFEDMAAYFAFFDYGTYNLVGHGEPERLVGVGVSQNFLSFLGVSPEIGRNFSGDEAKWNGPKAVILTNGLWQRRFGGDPAIVGRSITLNDSSFTVAGVLPASFDFSAVFTPGSRVDMVVPFPLTPETDRWGNTLAVIGRLKPGVSIQSAQAEFDVINQNLRAAHPERWIFSARMTPLQQHLTARFRRGLALLMFAVGLVLLIACTNLSNLLLARAASRKREVAIRSALGASRWRLVRQMLTESTMLSLAGAVVGLGFAWLAIRYVSTLQGITIPLLRTVRVDSTALLFTIAAAILTGLLFGLAPALQASSTDQASTLKESGRSASEGRRSAWLRGSLVVSEVALACLLVIGAGLLMRSLLQVLDVDLGFQPEQTAVWRVETGSRFTSTTQQVAYFDRLVSAVAAVPGVESVGLTDALPLSRDRSWGMGAVGAVYERGQQPLAHPRFIDWRYIPTMRIALLAGRNLRERDTSTSQPVIVINEKAARRLWPGDNPVGKMVRFGGERRVIGVVANVRHQAVEEEGGLEGYLPVTQTGAESLELVIRTRSEPSAVASSIRAALKSLDPRLPTAEFQTLGNLVERAVSPRRFLVFLLSGFAAAALILASLGIYGVVSYTVTQKTPEIGIRMALGATAGHVRAQILRRILALVVAGVLVGSGAALVLGRLASSLLYNMKATDLTTYASTVLVILGVATAAAWVPALRASRVDPMAALRGE
ncbi:MAG TPA: ABC transporter permease [Bryobacteraceae bacterium]|nr:ABC transporter permease [Bryobacteraceae bacterium]